MLRGQSGLLVNQSWGVSASGDSVGMEIKSAQALRLGDQWNGSH